MKRSNLLLGAAMATALVLMAGCTKEMTPDVPETVDRDQVRYVNVTISSPTGVGTRAGADDFLPGSFEENYVNRMVLVFYDRSGKPTGDPYIQVFKNNINDEDGDPGKFDPGEDNAAGKPGNVGKIWAASVPVSLKQGDYLPSYVMCFINPVQDAEFTKTSLEDIEVITRQQVITTVNGKDYFPMSNSVYYGDNPITGEKNVRMIATPISSTMLTTTPDASAAAVDIYVERYAARITLNLPVGKVNPNITAVNGYTLTFKPEYWRLNAVDQSIFAVKRLGLLSEGADEPNYEPSFGDLQKNFGASETSTNDSDSWWNDRANYRSYWGCSPSYYKNKYPMVSDDITDVVSNNSHINNYPFELHYFNYDQITKNTNGNADIKLQPSVQWNETSGFNKVFYARESTTASRAWKNPDKYNPMATMASAVIVGRYVLTPDGKDPIPEKTTFYLYGKTGTKWNLYFDDTETAEGIKAAMVKQQNVVFKKNGTSYVPVSNVSYFNVEHPSKDVRTKNGNAVVAGRLVALQLKNEVVENNATLDADEQLYFYDTVNKKYSAIGTDDINTVNSNLLSAGYARKYGKGLCYFSIPIEHLGIYGDDGNYKDGVKAEGKYKFENCPAGSFGIVRNHSYTINVTSIEGLATGLRDEYQPIVPPMEDVTYYINAKVNILNWRIVPAQSVTL